VLLQLQAAAAGGPLLLTLDAGRLQQQTAVDAFLGVGRFINTTALTGDDELLRYRASLRQTLDGSNLAFDTADWAVYWQGTETAQMTDEVRRAAPPRSPPVRLERAFTFDEGTLGLEFTAVKSVVAGSATHDVVYGIETTQTRIEERRDGLQTDLDTGVTTATILGEMFPLRDLPRSTVTELGVFVQDEIHWAESRWSLIPALRVDYYELKPEVDAIYRADNPSTRPVSVDEVSFAPKLGVLYTVNPRLGLFFQYAHGFRSPPPEDVNIGLEIPLFNVRAIPNPDLRPETSDGFEMGVRLTGEPWSMTASVFQTEYDDFIESKVNLGVDPATGVTLFQSQNLADARIEGVELDLRVDAAALATPLAGWTGRLAASWTKGDDLQRDQPLNSIDPPRAVLAVRYDAPSARWGSELALTAVEAQRRVDRSRADLYRTDGYATLDWLVNCSIGPRLRLNLGLFNLTDTRYIEWSDVRGRAAGDPLIPYYTPRPPACATRSDRRGRRSPVAAAAAVLDLRIHHHAAVRAVETDRVLVDILVGLEVRPRDRPLVRRHRRHHEARRPAGLAEDRSRRGRCARRIDRERDRLVAVRRQAEAGVPGVVVEVHGDQHVARRKARKVEVAGVADHPGLTAAIRAEVFAGADEDERVVLPADRDRRRADLVRIGRGGDHGLHRRGLGDSRRGRLGRGCGHRGLFSRL
jgi:hemoglobin/transferrin/lactoferrin receptor protein